MGGAISRRPRAVSFGRRTVSGRSISVTHLVAERRCCILDARRVVVGARR
jgi:hypothetical protein